MRAPNGLGLSRIMASGCCKDLIGYIGRRIGEPRSTAFELPK